MGDAFLKTKLDEIHFDCAVLRAVHVHLSYALRSCIARFVFAPCVDVARVRSSGGDRKRSTKDAFFSKTRCTGVARVRSSGGDRKRPEAESVQFSICHANSELHSQRSSCGSGRPATYV